MGKVGVHLHDQLCALVERVTKARAIRGAESPVSYTHLRAHETVLDLVCRLLLEKKNDTQKARHIQQDFSTYEQ